MDVVNSILQGIEENKTQAKKSIEVKKLIDPDFFAEELLVVDTNELNYKELHNNQDEYLEKYARECVQYLVNKLSAFPKEVKDGLTFAKCSGPAFVLPREKPIPVPKPLTKWQKFAQEKGIKKTKKPRVTWDDILQKWVPTYGYKKAAAEKEKEWLIEVPKNVDPKTDMFAEKKKVKKENIAKNEYQRLRNIAASRKVKVPEVGVPPMEGRMLPSQIQVAAAVARTATASLGEFQPNLPGEKIIKKKKIGNKKAKPFKTPAEEADTQRKINDQLQKRAKQAKTTKSNDDVGVKKSKGKKKNKAIKKAQRSFKKPKSEKSNSSSKRGSGRKRR